MIMFQAISSNGAILASRVGVNAVMTVAEDGKTTFTAPQPQVEDVLNRVRGSSTLRIVDAKRQKWKGVEITTSGENAVIQVERA